MARLFPELDRNVREQQDFGAGFDGGELEDAGGGIAARGVGRVGDFQFDELRSSVATTGRSAIMGLRRVGCRPKLLTDC